MTSSSLQLQFKKYVSNFFVTLQSMTVPNFMSKELSFQDLRRRHCLPLSGESSDKNTQGQIGFREIHQ